MVSISLFGQILSRQQKSLTMLRMHHLMIDINQFRLSGKGGGCAHLQLKLTMNIATIGTDTYLKRCDDSTLILVSKHEKI